MTSNGHSHGATLKNEKEGRWKGIVRPYSPKDVEKISGTVQIEYTLAKLGAERFWKLIENEKYIQALGALTGNQVTNIFPSLIFQAVQQVQAGLKAIYVSGWQVAADANSSNQMYFSTKSKLMMIRYPDQSLYTVDSVPNLVKKINNALLRADRIAHSEGKDDTYWFAPLVADAEAGIRFCNLC